jgi:preprotein translocase subunit SecA
MMDSIKEETVGYLFNVDVEVAPPASEEAQEAIEGLVDATGATALAGLAAAAAQGSTPPVAPAPTLLAKGLAPSRPAHMEYSAPSETGGVERGEMEVEDGGIVEVDPNASRAERRRAERENRRRGK